MNTHPHFIYIFLFAVALVLTVCLGNYATGTKIGISAFAVLITVLDYYATRKK